MSVSKRAATDAQERPLEIDFELRRGVWIEGRITDKQTGKGLSGRLACFVKKESPSYQFARSQYIDQRDRLLSDEEGTEYLRIQPYTPAGKNNMIAWIAARNDPPNYGQLAVYELPKQELVFGPIQVEARIDQDPEISAEAGQYARFMIPCLFAYGLLQCLNRFLQTQNIVFPMMFSAGVTTLLHILVCYILVFKS